MPCIVMYTNMEVPKEKAEELKKALVVSWEKLPGKSQVLGIQKERIFVAHDECPSWGWVKN